MVKMVIERINRKDGVRVRTKKFPYFKEGDPVGSKYNKIISGCQKQYTDIDTSEKLSEKLERWHKLNCIESRTVEVVSMAAMVFIIPFMAVTFLLWINDVGLWDSGYKPLIVFALIGGPCFIVFSIIKRLKEKNVSDNDKEQLYKEAKILMDTKAPEVFTCRITEKKWYEATDEASCYFLQTDYFTISVDLSKYAQISIGDYITFALISTRDDKLLFLI